jgi:hypothetical protein
MTGVEPQTAPPLYPPVFPPLAGTVYVFQSTLPVDSLSATTLPRKVQHL